jgi:hypothetical protein
MRAVTQYAIPILALSFVGGLVFWAYPEGGGLARQIGIILGWIGCGLLLASLFLVLREPPLASRLGGLKHMYWWHHRLGMAAYIASACPSDHARQR